jgi:hypothetical protein
VTAPESSLSCRVDCLDSAAFKDTNLRCLVKGTEGNVPRGASLLDAARSSFSSADAGVKTRKLVDRADNTRVIDARELTRSSGVDGQAPAHSWHVRVRKEQQGYEPLTVFGVRVHCKRICSLLMNQSMMTPVYQAHS